MNTVFAIARRSCAGVLVALGLALPASAQNLTPEDLVTATFLPGWRQPDGRHIAALRLDLAPGWKTYWRSPGAAGIPPSFDWAGSDNLADVSFVWPRPEVIDLGGIEVIGYHDQLVLPMVFTPQNSGPIAVTANVDLGVCSDICVPVSLSLSAMLPAGGARDPDIVAAMARRAETGGMAGVTGISCAVDVIDGGLAIEARVNMPRLGAKETVVIETSSPGVWVENGEQGRDAGKLTARAEFFSADGGPLVLDRGAVTINVIGPTRSVELVGCPAG